MWANGDLNLVGERGMNKCLIQLLHEKPVVYATHQLEFLDASDLILVLQKCHLADIVKQDLRLLDAPVAEDGENLSVDQRQIVCLARVLLQKRRILVLDEATASKTIREETNGCTVMTVTHRIPTIIDNDLVLVLGEGNILEFDTPNQLLKNSSSTFSNLVAEFL
ncbi:hypothetical protein R3W88_014367 [Solanum pinnatisectum]|uniref:ABC transporter domain-containing protein n=1 Tax=Solanum pinnatisectum TaxID=50273 RepID=A0AAV9KTV4_9SOLN|nr:hypothetical protein R3W88_014367 [Solanum pinnatisectum]